MAQDPIIGNIPGPKQDRGFWLDFSLALVMAVAWVFVYFGYRHVNGARHDHTMAAARVEVNELEREMDNRYGRVADDLREFGKWLEYASTDSFSARGLQGPLAPYVRRDPAIRAARLANERGDQWTVTNLDTALLISEHHLEDSTIVEWIHRPRVPDDTIRFDTLAEVMDPRSAAWFGAALQDRRGGARWGTPFPLADSTGMGITLSTALRNDIGVPVTRVFAFDMRLVDPVDLLPPGNGSNGPWLFILGPDGEQLLPSTVIPGAHEAIAEWKARAEPETIWVRIGEELHAMIVVPYIMNGVELEIGALMPLAPLNEQELISQYLLLGNAALVTVLSVLLIAAYRRRRRESEQHRQQQERSRSQRQRLAKAIGEREVLNREVHHRVKNNLQVVTSLLNLQLRKLEEGAAKDEFKRGVRRIDSMAVVHHKLYGLQDLRGIDLQKFFTGLVDSIATSTDTKGTTVSCAVDTAGIKADADTAIELGVILCELVGNCYQHAFPYATGGHIEVTVRHVEGDLHRLVVKDNGLGLGAGPTDGTGKLGLEIVEALSSQLDGNFKMSSSAGVTFDVLFRMSKPVQH